MKFSVAFTALAPSLLAPAFVSADWQFRSRPDLSPPRLNITIPASKDVAPGYIFVTPYPSFTNPSRGSPKPEQPAAYIFRNDGDLVWSSLGYLSGWVGNLQVARYKGQTVLQAFQGTLDPYHGHGYGSAVLLDQSYRQIKTIQSQDNKLFSIHEFRIVNERTALFEIYQPVVRDLTPWGGGKNEWIVDGVFQEIDIETGKIIFEAHSLDFADPSESITPLASSGKTSFDAWDYFHLNSVDKDDEGNYLVSGRHTSTIYKLSGKDGSLIWKLVGYSPDKNSSSSYSSSSPESTSTSPVVIFHLTDNTTFAYQHDARFLSRSHPLPPTNNNPTPNTHYHKIETISLFDNSAGSSPRNNNPNPNPTSSARILLLNHTTHAATQTAHFPPPLAEPILATSQGNAQSLPNGNIFINWGQAGAVTEYTADGTAVFHAYLESAATNSTGGGPGLVQSYRGFRFEWVGRGSRERPALVVLEEGGGEGEGEGDNGEGGLRAWVSWNGDTETVGWRFWGVSGGRGEGRSKRVELGFAERRSFETALVVSGERLRELIGGSGPGGYEVFAEALDGEGKVIGISSVVRVEGTGLENEGTADTLGMEDHRDL